MKPPKGTFTQLFSSPADSYTCGLHSDGTVECWGDGYYFSSASPPPGTFTQVSVSDVNACGLHSDGSIEFWGNTQYSGYVAPPSGPFTQVSTGGYYACGLHSDGTVECWGNNSWGQRDAPPGTFTQVSASRYYACGLHSDGTVECWGGTTGPPLGLSACAICGDGIIAASEECDDGNLVSNDGCTDTCVADCPATPRGDCRSAGISTLLLINSDNDAKDTLKWKWHRGAATAIAEVSNPTTTGRYNVCLYPNAGVLGAQILLSPQAGWSSDPVRGYTYVDRTRTRGGVSSLRLVPGNEAQATIVLTAKGENVPEGLLPATSYAIQLIDTEAGICWGSEFPSGGAQPGLFKGKATN